MLWPVLKKYGNSPACPRFGISCGDLTNPDGIFLEHQGNCGGSPDDQNEGEETIHPTIIAREKVVLKYK
jgi:hypothetical protein